MDSLYKPTPRPVFEGIRDSSRVQLPPVAEQLPTHLPHFYGFAERGSLGAKLAGGDDLKRIFGANTFLATSKFANHQTQTAAAVMGLQQIFFERLPAPGMQTAMLRLAVEVIADEIPDYERNLEDGRYVLDANADPVEQGTIVGHRVRWLLNPVGMNAMGFGEAQQLAGDMVSDLTDQESTIYPVMDLMVSFAGEAGNGLGLRFGSPTTTGAEPADGALMRSVRSYIHNIQLVEQSATSTPDIIASLGGDTVIPVVMKPGVENPRTSAEMSIHDVLIDAYRRVGDPGIPDEEGPFEKLHVYDSDFEAVCRRLIDGSGMATPPAGFQGEEEFDNGNVAGSIWRREGAEAMADPENTYMLNPFSGKDLNNVPYFSFVMASGTEAGITLSSSSAQYASGGNDGDTSPKAFDEAVRQQLQAYGSFSQVSNASNWGLYPWSDYYDTGFSLETKYAMADIIGVRRDIRVWLSTQEVWAPNPEDPEGPYVEVPQNTLNALGSGVFCTTTWIIG